MNITLAIILGTAFGFALHRVGASNPQNIINMLRLKDFHLMKVILFAIVIASSILFLGLSIGVINPAHLSVKTAYWGVVIGGLIFGAGWAIGGYCPGTGVAAIGEGRKDAMFFVVGGLVGAFLYTVIHLKLEGIFFLDKILGGKVTLALTPNESYKAILGSTPGLMVALIAAIILGVIAWRLPTKNK